MKLKFEEIARQVDSRFCTIESWLKAKSKKKDLACMNCKNLYSDFDTKSYVGLMTTNDGSMNKHICQSCAEEYEELDEVQNIQKGRTIRRRLRDEFDKYGYVVKLSSGKYISSQRSISDYSNDEIKEAIKIYEENEKERLRIEAITISEEDSKIDQYLIDEYNVKQNITYLKCEEQIEQYFKNDYYEFFECGQGKHQDIAHVIIKIADKYYDVTMFADVYSSKQEYGDRMYWVEKIKSVSWDEIEKPSPKNRVKIQVKIDNEIIDLSITEDRVKSFRKDIEKYEVQ